MPLPAEEFERAILRELRPQLQEAFEDSLETVERTAKNLLGEQHTFWAPLHPSTLRARAERGFAPNDEPLLEMGALRVSIEHQTLWHRQLAAQGEVGSNAPQARIQELGGMTAVGTYIPPRPYLATGLIFSEEAIVKKFKAAFEEAFERALGGT